MRVCAAYLRARVYVCVSACTVRTESVVDRTTGVLPRRRLRGGGLDDDGINDVIVWP